MFIHIYVYTYARTCLQIFTFSPWSAIVVGEQLASGVCGLIKKAMHIHGWAERKFLVDGFPRNDDNYTGWNEVMGDQVNVTAVLHFVVEEDTLI